MREENWKRGNGEADGVKRRALKEKGLVVVCFFPECNVSPRGQDVYVNRLSTPPVLLTSVLFFFFFFIHHDSFCHHIK